MTGNNPNLGLVNINEYTQFGQILSISSQDIEWKRIEILNKILTSVKGHNSVTNVRKMMCSNPNLDLHRQNLVKFYQFGKILFMSHKKDTLLICVNTCVLCSVQVSNPSRHTTLKQLPTNVDATS